MLRNDNTKPFFPPLQTAMEAMGLIAIIVNCYLIGQCGQLQRLFPWLSPEMAIISIVILEVPQLVPEVLRAELFQTFSQGTSILWPSTKCMVIRKCARYLGCKQVYQCLYFSNCRDGQLYARMYANGFIKCCRCFSLIITETLESSSDPGDVKNCLKEDVVDIYHITHIALSFYICGVQTERCLAARLMLFTLMNNNVLNRFLTC